jgi:hypothetical protein
VVWIRREDDSFVYYLVGEEARYDGQKTRKNAAFTYKVGSNTGDSEEIQSEELDGGLGLSVD